MSDEEHSDSEFYYPKEQETAVRKASHRGCRFDKVEASMQRHRDEKLVPVVLISVINSAI